MGVSWVAVWWGRGGRALTLALSQGGEGIWSFGVGVALTLALSPRERG
ncbi:hypothetical protein PPL19_10632 [Pseudomonas psychrotolerans L19]|nr:hypothetical protein PPL19_10632 [Pseudomonas psychrotolerans L19]